LVVLGKVLRFRDWPVRLKVVALLVAVSLAPVATGVVIDVRAESARLRARAADLLAARADQLSGELDTFHHTYQLAVSTVARLPVLATLCEATGADVPAATGPVRTIIDVLVATDPHMLGAGVLDRDGRVIFSTEPRMTGKVLGDHAYVRAALRGVKTISDVRIADPELGAAPTVDYAAPVIGSSGLAGIVIVWVRASALWGLARSPNELAELGSFAVVLDTYGVRIAHTASTELVFHPAGKLAPEVIEMLVAEHRFGADTRRLLEDVQPFREVFDLARNTSPDRGLFRGVAAVSHQRSYGVARRLGEVPWTVFYLLPETALDHQITAMKRDKAILAGLIMVIAFAVGLALAAAILRPVVSLSSATALISGGDFSARVPAIGDDELGRLCASFNAMAERIERDDAALRRSRDELEHRVAERTSALVAASHVEASARRDLEASTARLEVLSRTAHELAASSGDVHAVLELAVRRLGEIIGEGCTIRMLSDDGDWIEPTVSLYHPDPEKRAFAGQVFGSARQRVGEGIGGAVAKSGQALLLPEVTTERVSEVSPAFRGLIVGLGVSSLLTLPLRSRERTIGVVTLSRSQPGNPYTIHDQRFAQEVADRAGLAIDNAVLVATLERRVAARTAALEAANRELEAFSFSVSHDLRAPVRAIDGFSHVLLSDHAAQLDADGRHCLDRIRTATQRMAALIEDLLNLARITRVQLRWTPIDLTALAGQVVAELQRRDADRTIQVHIAPGLASHGDARLLTIVLDNLLGNAWKFTAKHAAAEIWFGEEHRDGQQVFFVRDQGAGFDMKYADKLFHPFHRLHSADEFDGHGVGLATVHRIISHHGGRIWAEAAVGQGATFFFALGDPG